MSYNIAHEMNLWVSIQCVMYCSVAVVKLSVLRPYPWSLWKRYGALLSLHYRHILISDCLLSIMTLDSCTNINNRSTMIDLLMTNYLLLIIYFDVLVLTLTYMIFLYNNLLMIFFLWNWIFVKISCFQQWETLFY